MGSEPIRRVVTGHSRNAVAQVITDSLVTNTRQPRPGVASTLIWSSDRTPAEIAIGESVEDLGARTLRTQPPSNGSRFTVMDFQPGVRSEMHRTESLDYIAVLAGEIDMDMDDSTVKLKAGDVMVQRGTNHCWVNRSTEPARLAIVLLDAQPLGIGHPRLT
jgi:quercetin dioxygenase-like cupin family protein